MKNKKIKKYRGRDPESPDPRIQLGHDVWAERKRNFRWVFLDLFMEGESGGGRRKEEGGGRRLFIFKIKGR